jgi:hypothetical protein
MIMAVLPTTVPTAVLQRAQLRRQGRSIRLTQSAPAARPALPRSQRPVCVPRVLQRRPPDLRRGRPPCSIH